MSIPSMNSLPLTPFEEYMLLDSHPACPMSCFLKLRLQGRLDVDRLDAALQTTLGRHPLLRSRVVETDSGRFRWEETDRFPVLVRRRLDEDRPFPASTGIDLYHEPALKATLCLETAPGEDACTEGTSDLVFEVHHSAADAIGTRRFLEDFLLEYAGAGDKASEDSGSAVSREAVAPELLGGRGAYGLTFGRFLRLLPRQLWGFHRAWTFLLHRVLPLVPEKRDLSAPRPPPGFPAILTHQLDERTTEAIRRRAKTAGVTINDLLLDATFQAMNAWRRSSVDEDAVSSKNRRGFLRIAVPTNLRGPWDRLMPAANIVSMVFIDRKPKDIRPEERFLRGIHREMRHIKRCNLGLAFIHGLTVYRRVFGSFTKMIKRDRCWTTATVSNLGSFFVDGPFSRRDGRIRLGDDLELVRIDSVPPVRPQTPLGVCVSTYAGRMTLDMHYDGEMIARDDARALLDSLLSRFCPPDFLSSPDVSPG